MSNALLQLLDKLGEELEKGRGKQCRCRVCEDKAEMAEYVLGNLLASLACQEKCSTISTSPDCH